MRSVKYDMVCFVAGIISAATAHAQLVDKTPAAIPASIGMASLSLQVLQPN